MSPIPLSFDVILGYLTTVIAGLKDPRKPSNATSYTLRDIVLGAFSVFYMQSESFLDYQRYLNSRQGRDNAQSLFGLDQIPSVEQLRNVLDLIAPEPLSPVFESIYEALMAQGYLTEYPSIGDTLLVALDGTTYHSSRTIHCPCCSTKTSKSGITTYFHQALLPVIVSPNQSSVISLPPAFITPQDGHDKQDCEQSAAKRWLIDYSRLFQGQEITLLGDDLYSCQPMCELCLEHDYSFIFVCLPESHRVLYDWVEFQTAKGGVTTVTQRKRTKQGYEDWQYRYLNDVPLRAEDPSLSVNWCELTVTRASDGRQLYHNSWITNHRLTDESVVEVAAAGRSRWKTENENHNVLKTRGYHLEHNFGHGQQFLASTLLTLNLLAFLVHTVLDLVDERYQQLRQQIGTRKGFFRDMLALTKYTWFESWEALVEFMLDEDSPKTRKARKVRPNTS